jgi:hypothetical protein
VLADEDVEEDPDRWCSYTECGQELGQIACQWVWNLRLSPSDRRCRASRCARSSGPLPKKLLLFSSRKNPHRKSMAPGSGPPLSDEPQGVSGPRTRVLQEDGKLRCPAGASLWLSEVRQENAFTKAGRLPGLPDGLSALFFARAVSGIRSQRGSSPPRECGPSSLASTRTCAC